MTTDIETTETTETEPIEDTEEEQETPVETEDTDEAETFPRDYVEKLRDENAKYRQRAGRADDLAQRLHASLVAATGRLADPSDLVFDEAHLEDDDALNDAINDLLARKPHLASRRVRGDIGQGTTTTANTDLAGILRSRA